MPGVIHKQGFTNTLASEIAYLRDRGEPAWIQKLDQDLLTIEQLLARFPEAGREITRQGTDVLRKLRLRRVPFYVWYAFDPSQQDLAVRLYRLYHVRQKTTAPRTLWP